MDTQQLGDVNVRIDDDYVARVEIQRGPNNFFDARLIADLADAFEALDRDKGCRAIVLCSEGKNFCAGAKLGGPPGEEDDQSSDQTGYERLKTGHLYDEAVRLFSTRTPVVAAIQGAAIGGGLGLALMPDFRIAAPEARFAANFARLGFHQGFGLSVTLPALIGQQRALEMFYTGRRVKGEEALRLGLCEELVPIHQLRDRAHAFAKEIATSAPLAIDSIRETMRGELAQKIREATDREKAEQDRLRLTDDFKEGVAAMNERRIPNFNAQ